MESANEYPSAPRPAEASGYGEPVQRRARIGIVVLTTVIVELALIGGLANQTVSEQIARQARRHSLDVQLLGASWLTYTWRFTPHTGESRVWGSQLLLILTVVVVSALLVWCLLRGPVGFGRAFFGTWVAVVAASLVGGFVRGIIDPTHTLNANRANRAAFGSTGPTHEVVVGAVGFGLVVGLIVAIVAVATRRSGRPLAAAEPAGPPAFADYGPPPASTTAAMPPWQDQHYGPRGGATTPSYGEPEPAAATTRLPDLGAEGRPSTVAGAAGAGAQYAGSRYVGPEYADSQYARPEYGEQEHAGSDESAPTTALPALGDEGDHRPGAQRAWAEDQRAQVEQPGQEGAHAEERAQGERRARAEEGPRGEAGPSAEPAPGPTGDQATARFPRPPDDDQLGHIDH